MNANENLTRHQSLVYETLSEMEEPAGAYALLERLQKYKLRSPQQIYRALEKLINLNLVHKLDSLNAFIACRKQNCSHHKSAVFMICDQCRHVREITNEHFGTALNRLIADENFSLTESTLELNGFCNTCQSGQNKYDRQMAKHKNP